MSNLAIRCEGLSKRYRIGGYTDHYKVLREAGLIRSERRGTEVVNTLRCDEINAKFPGVLPAILKAAAAQFDRATEDA